nr:hypothetical protein [Vibrio anguillarum]
GLRAKRKYQREFSLKPEVLYKYRDDSKRTEDIIKNQKVWLSSPKQLNDPLECRTGENIKCSYSV